MEFCSGTAFLETTEILPVAEMFDVVKQVATAAVLSGGRVAGGRRRMDA
ncbi:hypothetical protein [Nocardia sp. NBC_01377]